MKKLKLLLLIAGTLSLWQLKAQTTIPPLTQTIPIGNQLLTSQSITGTEKWYTWTADTGVVHVGINLIQNGLINQLASAELYTINSGTLVLMYKDTLETTDSILNLYAGYVSANTQVYIRILNSASTCTTCVFNDPLINLKVENVTVGCAPVTPCDMVKNGGFESAISTGCGYDITDGVDCWYPYENSTDVLRSGCIGATVYPCNLGVSTINTSPPLYSHSAGNNAIVGQLCKLNPSHLPTSYYSESIQSLLINPLIAGRNYSLSYWVYNYSGPFSSSDYANPLLYPCFITIATSSGLANSPSSSPGIASTYPNANPAITNLTTINVVPVNTWTQYTYTFTFTGATSNNLLVGPNLNSNLIYGNVNHTDNRTLYVAFDDISIKDITPITVTSPSVCLGSNTTINSSNSLATYTAQPGSYTGLGSILVTPSVTTIYTITPEQPIGCLHPTIFSTVTVKPLPTVTLTASNYTICPGVTTTLSATGSTGIWNYTWLPSGIFGGVGTSIVVSPSVTTTYTVHVFGANGCSNIGTIKITVLNPTVNIGPTALAINCPGYTNVLTVFGLSLTSYTWSTGANTNNISVNPTVTTTYSVATTNTCGLVATNSIVVTVFPPQGPISASASPNPICIGQTSTLTSLGAVNYTWQPGSAMGNTIAVTPSITTTYTVFGDDGFCPTTQSAVVTVSVNVPAIVPFFTISSPTGTNICANGTGTNVVSFNTSISPSSNYSFNWTPGGITTPTANIDITQTTLISVSVTSSLCPLAPITQTIAVNYVNNKCCLPFTGTVLTTTNIVGPITLTGNYKVPTGNIITYSGEVNLLNCTFLMGEGSRMVAMPSCSLALQDCKIFSCEGMWFGIEMKNNSIDNSYIQVIASKIEDAYHAIHASVGSIAAPSINLLTSNVNNTLNKNYVDVYIENWNSVGNTYPFTSEKTDYLSKSTVTSPGSNLKTNTLYVAPFIAPRSNIGIYAASATSVNIVSITFTLNINTFENKDYGIFMKQTHATINNADFKNMSGFIGSCTSPGCVPPNPTGVGIISSSNFGGHELNVISLPLAPITFNNVQCAVYANRLGKVTVTDIDINNPAQTNWGGALAPVPKGIGYNGIYIADILSEAHVNYNTIKNTYYGVQAVYSSTSITSAAPVVLSISNNTIFTAGTHTTQTAINVSNALVGTVNPSSFPIAANTITRVKNGIYAQGMAGGLRISNNIINLLSGSTSASNGNGIYLRGGNSNCVVDNNSIFGNSTGAVNTYNVGKLGINILTSPNCFVQCNTIEKVGVGIQYDGVNGTSNDGFFSNTLNYPIRRGLVLKNNGFIGTQGSYVGTPPIYTVTATSENQWAFPWNTVLSDQTYINDPGSHALGSRLCVSNNPIEKPNDNQFNSITGAVSTDAYFLNLSLLQSNTAAPITSCPLPLTVGAKMAAPVITSTTSPLARDAVFNQVITQTIPDSTIAPETKWMLKQHMHRTIKQSAVPTVTTVQSFYAVSQTQSVNTYFVVDSLINAGLLPQAIIQNSSATSTCVIEQNHKDFNQLWLTNLSDTSHIVTLTDIGILQSIANQCIHKGGRSVAQARAMLASIYFHPEEYDDDCFGDGKRMANTTDNEEGVTMLDDAVSFVNVFPNPNNGTFTINYNLVNVVVATILVEDITGKLIYSMGLDVSTNTLNLNLTEIVNGIYFVKIKNKDAIISVNKVIINN
jgi:hypothetical protein